MKLFWEMGKRKEFGWEINIGIRPELNLNTGGRGGGLEAPNSRIYII